MSSCWIWVSRFFLFRDDDFIHPILLFHAHQHLFLGTGRNILSDVIRVNGELAMTPVHQDCQAYGDRTAEVDDLIDGGPGASAGG